MLVTLEIPDALYRQLKARAAMERRPVKGLIIRSIRRELKTYPPRRQPVKFPLIRGKEKRHMDLTREQIDEVLWGS